MVIELTDAGYVMLGSAEDVAGQEARDAVLANLGDDGLTLAELVTATGLKRTSVQSALTQLVAAGSVSRSGEGKRGDPFRFQKVSAGLPPKGGYEPPSDTPVADGASRPLSQPTASPVVARGPDLVDIAQDIFGGQLIQWPIDDRGAIADLEGSVA